MMEQRELIRLQKELLNPEKMKKCQEQKRKHRSVRGSSVNDENLGHDNANAKRESFLSRSIWEGGKWL